MYEAKYECHVTVFRSKRDPNISPGHIPLDIFHPDISLPDNPPSLLHDVGHFPFHTTIHRLQYKAIYRTKLIEVDRLG